MNETITDTTTIFQKIQELNNVIRQKRAELEIEILEDLAKLKQKITAARQIFPDYLSPLVIAEQPAAPTRGGKKSEKCEQFIAELFAYLPTDAVNRVSRRELHRKFGATYGEDLIDNALNRIYKRQTVVNGFRLEKTNIPEDTYNNFIKVAA